MLSQDQQTRLANVMNTATVCAANALSEMIEQRVSIQLLHVSLVGQQSLREFVDHEINAIGALCILRFRGASNGSALFILPLGHDDILLSAAMAGENDPGVLAEMKPSVITETGNVILNACVGTVANELNISIDFLVPELVLKPGSDQVIALASAEISTGQEWLLVTSRMSVGALAFQAYILMMVANIFPAIS